MIKWGLQRKLINRMLTDFYSLKEYKARSEVNYHFILILQMHNHIPMSV